MNVLHFLLKIDNVLSHKTCNQLIKIFKESEHKDRLERKGYPNWTNLFLCNHYPEVEKELNHIYLEVAHKYQEWLGEYGNTYTSTDFVLEGSNIKRYVGGTDDVYKRHADVADISTSHRFLAFIFYLNDDFKGGETIFYPECVIRPEKGSVLVFPPYWMFPHEGTPVIRGEKYIMSNYCLWNWKVTNG